MKSLVYPYSCNRSEGSTETLLLCLFSSFPKKNRKKTNKQREKLQNHTASKHFIKLEMPVASPHSSCYYQKYIPPWPRYESQLQFFSFYFLSKHTFVKIISFKKNHTIDVTGNAILFFFYCTAVKCMHYAACNLILPWNPVADAELYFRCYLHYYYYYTDNIHSCKEFLTGKPRTNQYSTICFKAICISCVEKV